MSALESAPEATPDQVEISVGIPHPHHPIQPSPVRPIRRHCFEVRVAAAPRRRTLALDSLCVFPFSAPHLAKASIEARVS